MNSFTWRVRRERDVELGSQRGQRREMVSRHIRGIRGRLRPRHRKWCTVHHPLTAGERERIASTRAAIY